jgi:hypothetical protein
MKAKPNGGASVRELKAAALDAVVKAELAKSRASQAAKMSNLKALRLARDAEQSDITAPVKQTKVKSWPRRTPRARSAS